MELITLNEYKQFAGISSTNQDTLLTQKVSFANSFVTSYLGLDQIYPEDSEGYLVEYSSSPILLDYSAPVSKLFNFDTSTLAETEIDSADFKQVGQKIYFTPNVLTGLIKVVTSTSTYTVPEAVKEACYQLVKYYVKEEYKQQQQSGSEQLQTTTPISTPIHIKNILDLYREA